MNSVHDMGGMHGFGSVEREENEPVFHDAWERTVCGLNFGLLRARAYNLDEFRHGIERMQPARYLASTYYERWLAGMTRVLTEKGVVTEEELDRRTALIQDNPDATPAPAASSASGEPFQPPATTSGTHPFRRPAAAPPRFALGDAVVTRNIQPHAHTRLPRYARGKRGVIDRLHGVFVFPDANAHERGEEPQPVYSVRFDARDLWGESVEGREALYLDLWETYLLPA